MLYFSELRFKKVFTEDHVFLGRLSDLIFLASETAKITKLVIVDKSRNRLIIPVEFMSQMNDRIIIKKNYIQEDIVANELYVLKNLLDKQIIDLKGSKIVRVNDVIIQNDPFLYIAGVDIGLLGILRQLNIEKPVLDLLSLIRLQISSRFLSWGDIQPIELAYGRVTLKKEQKKLEELRPEDLAAYLEKTNILNIRKFLKVLDDRTAADVINFLNVNYQTSIFRHFKPDRAAKILSLMDYDEAADVLLTMSKKTREEILNLVEREKKKKIQYLLKLPRTSISDILTIEYITVKPQTRVREVIEQIRKTAYDFSRLPYVYVINQKNELIGAFSLFELIIHDSDTEVYKIMIQNLVVIHLTTPVDIALKKMLKYKLQVLPVINDQKQILGIVALDNLSKPLLDKLP